MLEITKVNHFADDNKVITETLFSLNGIDGEYTRQGSRKILGNVYKQIRLGVYSIVWGGGSCKTNKLPSDVEMTELSNAFGLSFDNIKLSTEYADDDDELY